MNLKTPLILTIIVTLLVLTAGYINNNESEYIFDAMDHHLNKIISTSINPQCIYDSIGMTEVYNDSTNKYYIFIIALIKTILLLLIILTLTIFYRNL